MESPIGNPDVGLDVAISQEGLITGGVVALAALGVWLGAKAIFTGRNPVARN